MKLGNKGWGLAQMLVMSGILFFLLLIVSYYIYVFYNNLDVKTGSQYFELEAKLQSAAILYSKNNDSTYGNVSLYTLKKAGYIDNFVDINNDDCNGYVIYSNDIYNSYIRCRSFMSENYDRKYE